MVKENGTDFTSIALLMGKPRDQIKRKFKFMEKKIKGFGFCQPSHSDSQQKKE